MSETDEQQAGTDGPEPAPPAGRGGVPAPGTARRTGRSRAPEPGRASDASDSATDSDRIPGPAPAPDSDRIPGTGRGPAPAPDDTAAPATGDAPAPGTAPSPAPVAENYPVPTARTRFGGLWVVLISGTVVLVLLLVFILQNSQRVEVHIYGGHWNAPLGVALLMASALGVLLVVVPGTGRIIQLRRAALRAHRRATKLAQTRPPEQEQPVDGPQA